MCNFADVFASSKADRSMSRDVVNLSVRSTGGDDYTRFWRPGSQPVKHVNVAGFET